MTRLQQSAERIAFQSKQFLIVKFRSGFKISQSAIEIANELFEIADILRQRLIDSQSRSAEKQCRVQNIAEGSGSSSKKEFSQF